MVRLLALAVALFSLGLVGRPVLLADEPATTTARDKDARQAPDDKDTKEAAAKRAAEEFELQKLFADTLDQVERNYVKKVSRRELMEAAIHGVLSKLDPYSNYINPDDLGQFKTSVENQFGGIGIQVDMPRNGRLTVVSPLVGSPAYRAGMQAGDQIVEIEGKDTEDLHTVDDAVARLKGEPGTAVTITTLRPSTGERKTFTIERELVQLETVLGDQRKPDDTWDYMLDRDRKIGYIRITAFGRDTERDLAKALEQLKKEGLRGLVLDLRFNPGGLLTSAIAVADLFVAEGKIVSTEGRNTTPRSWDAQKEGTYEGFPMVVLVNRYSASASEIVSACLQDHKRAVVVGERTWGKGSVQNVIEMEGGKSALKLTTASYQRPNGQNIHRFPDAKESDTWGVAPDSGFDLKLDDGELRQLVVSRHDRDVLIVNHLGGKKPDAAAEAAGGKEAAPQKPAADAKNPAGAAGGGGDPAATAKNAAQKPPFIDRQLKKAIDYLSTELARN